MHLLKYKTNLINDYLIFFYKFEKSIYKMTTKTRIHIADDHQILIDGLRTIVQIDPNFEVVGSSLNGLNLYEEVIENKTDILILDISMPEKDGIEVIKEFHEKGYPCKVIILSSYDDLKMIQEIMKLGASAYLTKQCAGESIVEAIQAVKNGEEYFCSFLVIEEPVIHIIQIPSAAQSSVVSAHGRKGRKLYSFKLCFRL